MAYGPQNYGTRTPPLNAIWTVFLLGVGVVFYLLKPGMDFPSWYRIANVERSSVNTNHSKHNNQLFLNIAAVHWTSSWAHRNRKLQSRRFSFAGAESQGRPSEPPKRGRKTGAARKLSKSVEIFLTLFDAFWRFFALRKNCQKVSKNYWRVPNPPGANPLVAERAFHTSDYWGRTGVAGRAEEMTGICRDFQ